MVAISEANRSSSCLEISFQPSDSRGPEVEKTLPGVVTDMPGRREKPTGQKDQGPGIPEAPQGLESLGLDFPFLVAGHFFQNLIGIGNHEPAQGLGDLDPDLFLRVAGVFTHVRIE